VVFAFVAVPAVQTVWYSLQKVAPGQPGTFVGLGNYGRLLGNPAFLDSLRITILFAVSFFALSTVLGLIFALLLNEEFRGRSIARTLLVLPWAVPPLIVGVIWHWLVDGNVGWLNGLLYVTHVQDSYFPFLADTTWALVVVVVAGAWRQSSLAGLIFLAALQTLPRDLTESAAVDGATSRQRFRHITLPWLLPTVLVVSVVNLIYGFLTFDVIFAMTLGGPGSATTILSLFMYRELFQLANTGLGSAVAVILGVTALAAGALVVGLLYRRAARFEQSGAF
jgi:multiple sugar transport system permease protein